jgi:hypothetical protein
VPVVPYHGVATACTDGVILLKATGFLEEKERKINIWKKQSMLYRVKIRPFVWRAFHVTDGK